MIDGFINLNKKKGVTSHDEVDFVRKIFSTKKVGHSGTLDPFATGVLVMAVNKGTRFLEYLSSDSKKYHVKAKLGEITDTFDVTGIIQEKNEVLPDQKEKVFDILKSFLGEYMQTPPAYSAKKYKGKKLYEYARKGEIINLPPKKVEIISIEKFKQEGIFFEFEVEVSSGTYIRSLVMDLGYKLGCGAVTMELERTKCGFFDISNSVNEENINEDSILPIERVLNFPRIKVKNGEKVKNGIQIYKNDLIEYDNFNKDSKVKIFDENNDFIGVGKAEKNSIFVDTIQKNEERNDRIVKISKILR
jgi:tRNA pseudouridine55 synthase